MQLYAWKASEYGQKFTGRAARPWQARKIPGSGLTISSQPTKKDPKW